MEYGGELHKIFESDEYSEFFFDFLQDEKYGILLGKIDVERPLK